MLKFYFNYYESFQGAVYLTQKMLLCSSRSFLFDFVFLTNNVFVNIVNVYICSLLMQLNNVSVYQLLTLLATNDLYSIFDLL